jgi:hypothetical protein
MEEWHMDLQKIRYLDGKSLNELSPEEMELFFLLQKNDQKNKIKASITSDAPHSELSKAKSEKNYYEILSNYNNKIAIDIEEDLANQSTILRVDNNGEVVLKEESDNSSLFDTLKKSIIFWILIFAAIGSLLSSQKDNSKSNEQPIISKEQKIASKKLIAAFGYKCDKIDSIIQSSWDGNYSVACNGYLYMYEIKDKGGNWIVTLDN